MKIPKIVYLVTGHTGEYSDYHEWPVAVFAEGDKAKLFRDLCSEVVKGADRLKYAERVALEKSSPYDPNLSVDTNGTTYDIVEVPFSPKFKG